MGVFKNFSLLFGVFFAVMLAFGALYAVTPDVSLPEWHALKIRLANWRPATGEITVETELRAVDTSLSEITAEMHWPNGFVAKTSRRTCSMLHSGRTWKIDHTAVVRQMPYEGWLELELFAKPGTESIKKKLDAIATYSPAMRQIMNSEVAALSKPIPIGRSLPLYIDENIAVLMPRSLVFFPLLKSGDMALHLWAPEVIAPAGVASELANFRTALNVGKEGISKAIKTIDAAMAMATDSVELACGDINAPFTVPLNVFREAMSLNRAVLTAAGGGKPSLSRLESFVKQCKGHFTEPFAWADLGVLQIEAGLKSNAAKSFEKAVAILETWPLLYKWQAQLEKKK